jgi:hypothetical protein
MGAVLCYAVRVCKSTQGLGNANHRQVRHVVHIYRGHFLSYRASVGMLARSSGASFRAGLSVPTDECME